MEFWLQLNVVLAPLANVVLIGMGPVVYGVAKVLYYHDKRLSHVETVQKLRRVERGEGAKAG